MDTTPRGYQFAVVDVETTGLLPQRSDRIIEIALLRLDAVGAPVAKYSTLINPQRDVGPTHIHGITARDVRKAPTFRDVAGDIRRMLAGAVFVAHNVSFDYRFVRSEFARMNYAMPEVPRLCTMKVARRLSHGLPNRKLETCCRELGIPLKGGHCAHNDATATAQILSRFIQQADSIDDLPIQHVGTGDEYPPEARWPELRARRPPMNRLEAAQHRAAEPSFIARLVAAVKSSSGVDDRVEEYHALLDRVLEDRRVSEDEAQELSQLAHDSGLSKDEMVSAHEHYLRDLCVAALADGILSETEKQDLREVRRLLGIGRERFREIFHDAKTRAKTPGPTRKPLTVDPQQLIGRTVCFTGALTAMISGQRATRQFAEDVAREHGMVITTSVSKKLDYLVVADADSQSGKAMKARKYGVRLIAEPVFWNMLGIDTGN